jgi:hypothetical protein
MVLLLIITFDKCDVALIPTGTGDARLFSMIFPEMINKESLASDSISRPLDM